MGVKFIELSPPLSLPLAPTRTVVTLVLIVTNAPTRDMNVKKMEPAGQESNKILSSLANPRSPVSIYIRLPAVLSLFLLCILYRDFRQLKDKALQVRGCLSIYRQRSITSPTSGFKFLKNFYKLGNSFAVGFRQSRVSVQRKVASRKGTRPCQFWRLKSPSLDDFEEKHSPLHLHRGPLPLRTEYLHTLARARSLANVPGSIR